MFLKHLLKLIVLSLFATQLFAAKPWLKVKSTIEDQKITANDRNVDDKFGYKVSISGNWAMVGAIGTDNDNGISSGSVYVLKFNGSKWNQKQKLIVSDPGVSVFGISLSLTGTRAAIGASGGVDNLDHLDSVYIYDFDGSKWNKTQKLNASDGESNDFFGSSVSLIGDRVLIGAFDDNHGSGNTIDKGSAYIFDYDGLQWNETQKITASDAFQFDNFGSSVSLSKNRALIGATGDNTSTGSAYIFEFDGLQWNETQKITASDRKEFDIFGFSVSLIGDRALIGATGADAVKTHDFNSGAAYVYDFNGSTWIETKLITSEGLPFDNLGSSVSLSGNRALIGAPHGFDNYSAGSVYQFEFNGSIWKEVQKLRASNDDDGNGLFGASVSLSDNHALIGDHFDDFKTGSAYIFEIDIIYSNGFE